jgi:SAM-dependent methyltransferase
MATHTVPVDATNADQLQEWDGEHGNYWATHADHYDRAMAGYHHGLLAAAHIGGIDRVLDIGCGTGQTTRDAARAADAGSALGVDLSSSMIDIARRRAAMEGLTNVRFAQVDAQIHAFDAETCDVAISRTGAMFFGDPAAAFSNIRRSLRPGARMALLTWQPPAANEWIRELSVALAAGRQLPTSAPDAPGPFSLSDPGRVKTILTRAEFTDIELTTTKAAMWFGEDIDVANHFVLGQFGWMLEGLDNTRRARALDALRATLTAHETDDGVVYESAAWIITATRR